MHVSHSKVLNVLLAVAIIATAFATLAAPTTARAAGPIVVTPASADWLFVNDNGTTGDWTAGFQDGPATPPSGVGSVRVGLNSATAGIVFGSAKYGGTKLADIQALSYSTYTNLSPAAMSFQINYDPDVTAGGTRPWFGRLTYEPYMNGTVTNGTWQTWDMLNGGNGKWWASPNGTSPVDDTCGQATPCTWSYITTTWPNIGVRNDAGTFVMFKAGSNWNGFQGNVDNFTFETGGVTDTYDFEPAADVYVNGAWAGTTPGTDPDGAGPAHSFGGDAFDTIQGGVDGVAPSGTVHVAAGTYNESLITISKPLTLSGAGAATTTVDGGGVAAAGHDGLVKVVGVSGPVTVEGFTLQNAGGDLAGTISLVLVDHNTASGAVTLQNNHFIGRNGGDLFDIGVWSYSTDGGITLQNNEFEKMWQGVLLERPRAGGRVLNNNFHGLVASSDGSTLYEAEAIFSFAYTDPNVTALLAVNGNTFTGFSGSSIALAGGYPAHPMTQFTNVEIKNNTINAVGSGPERRHVGIYLINYATTLVDSAAGGIANALISGNTITTGGVDSYGILLSGRHPNLTIQDNQITNLGTGVGTNEKNAGAGFPQGVAVHGNRFTGNTTAVKNGSTTDAADIINAENNWWGAASGPTHTSNPSGTGDAVSDNVDFTPWCGQAACSTTIPPYPTSTVFVSHNPNPSAVAQSVSIQFAVTNTAVSSPVPAGTVDVKDGSTVICSAVALDVSGHGSCNYAFPTSGAHNLSAVFTPTDAGQFATSTGTAKHNVTATVTRLSVGLQDGWVLESSEQSSHGGTYDWRAPAFNVGDDKFDRQYRGVLSFNTQLPAGAVVTRMTLRLRQSGLIVGINPFNVLGSLVVDLKKGTFGTAALQSTDFEAAASKVAAFAVPNTPSGGWYSATLGVTANSLLNKAGTTQMRLRFTKDDNDNRSANLLKFYSGDAAAGIRPQLIITYYVP